MPTGNKFLWKISITTGYVSHWISFDTSAQMSYLGFQLSLWKEPEQHFRREVKGVSCSNSTSCGSRWLGQQESSGIVGQFLVERIEIHFIFVQFLLKTESVSKGSMVQSLVIGNLVPMYIKCEYFKGHEGHRKVWMWMFSLSSKNWKKRTIKMDLEPASIVIELRREAVY